MLLKLRSVVSVINCYFICNLKSCIVCSNVSLQELKTFSIGFDDSRFDEAPYAKKIAHLLQTDHCELYLSDSDVLNFVERLSTRFTEPYADSSQIATLAVSELAAKSVKVVLTGDGADELFGGYTRYKVAPIIWKYLS